MVSRNWLYEDVDFSFNIRDKHKLALLSNAKVAHYQHPVLSDSYYILGKWQIVNRLYFVRKYKHRGLSINQAWLSSFTVIFLNIFLGFIRRDTKRFRCAYGNIVGIILEITCKERKIDGYLK